AIPPLIFRAVPQARAVSVKKVCQPSYCLDRTHISLDLLSPASGSFFFEQVQGFFPGCHFFFYFPSLLLTFQGIPFLFPFQFLILARSPLFTEFFYHFKPFINPFREVLGTLFLLFTKAEKLHQDDPTAKTKQSKSYSGGYVVYSFVSSTQGGGEAYSGAKPQNIRFFHARVLMPHSI